MVPVAAPFLFKASLLQLAFLQAAPFCCGRGPGGLLVHLGGQNRCSFLYSEIPDYAQELNLPLREYLLYLLSKLSCIFIMWQDVGVLCAVQMRCGVDPSPRRS